MPRFVIVLPLSPLQVGDSFAVHDWPLHITVLPPFQTDAAAGDIAEVLVAATTGLAELTVMAGPVELFGRREDVPVTVITPDGQLTHLHDTLVAALRPFAASPEEPAFTGPGFRAHVTIKNHPPLYAGEKLTLNQIALVDMAPRSTPSGRAVLATLRLTPRTTIAG